MKRAANTEFQPVPPGKKRLGIPGGRPLGVHGQILLGFGAFTAVIVVLLWVFQIFLLNPFYRAIKTAEVRSTADTVLKNLDLSREEMDGLAKSLSLDTGINIVVTDETGTLYGNCFYSQKESPLFTALSQGSARAHVFLAGMFDQVNLKGGNFLEKYTPEELTTRKGTSTEIILYARISRTADGNSRMVLMESEITPVDSTVETLKVQLLCLTAVMILLGIVLAVVIARRIARPLTAINESAKQLGRGEYAIRFAEEGTREVSELAHTLNFAAAELSKVEQLRRELLANVSHDLRTPLTMIKGYSEVMRDLPGENTPENVQIIIDETERLTDLVNDLLDLSRLEAGVVPLDKTRFDLTESIRAMLSRYDKLADYSFPFFAGRDVFVTADELRVSQVVYNLVNNAITYAGEDKTITLRQTVEDGKVRISVTDTGEGIPPDKLKDIWERYYKVDKEHKRAQVGTGLGLSIVKNVLDLHGGAYGVESQLGAGSTFWFELPLSEENGVRFSPGSSPDGELRAEGPEEAQGDGRPGN